MSYPIPPQTFIERCVLGLEHPDDIDDYIETYHNICELDFDYFLRRILGLTREEYAEWLKPNSTILEKIIWREKLNWNKD